MTINFAIIGALGKMGKSIAKLSLDDSSLNFLTAIEASNSPSIGNDYATLSGIPVPGVSIVGHIPEDQKLDVIIDFSFKDATLEHVQMAAERQIPYVIGTTGFDENELEIIINASKKTAILLSPNMSLAVNVLFATAQKVTAALGGLYDIEIVEAHHNQKKDAPSGTATKLFDVISEELGWDSSVLAHGREGISGARPKKEIGMHAIRGGGIVGEHRVIFAGPEEQLEIKHQALNRDTFARGALQCAKFLAGKPHGKYSMKEVLGL